MSSFKTILLSFLLISSACLQAQVAIEVAKVDGLYTVYPLMEKGSSIDPAQFDGGIYTSNLHHPQAKDFKDPVYIEFLLNQISLFQANDGFEVLFLIPMNEVETTVVCNYDGKKGYLKLIRMTESFE